MATVSPGRAAAVGHPNRRAAGNDDRYSAHEIRARPDFMGVAAKPADAPSGLPSRAEFRTGRTFARSGRFYADPRGNEVFPIAETGFPPVKKPDRARLQMLRPLL